VNRVGEIVRDLKIPNVVIAAFDLAIDSNPIPNEVISNLMLELGYSNVWKS